MSFEDLLMDFTAAVAAGDGTRFARCFTEDGEYHDVFYGTFRGRSAIADMLENRFHRDGEHFRWQMVEPLSDGRVGYARWLFSYTAKTPESRGRRVLMEGCGHFHLHDGLIRRYEDIAKIGEVLVQLGLPPDKMHRALARMNERLHATPEAKSHMAGSA